MTERIPIHPGEILREEFLVPLGITAYRLAKEIQVPVPRIHDIVLEEAGNQCRYGVAAGTLLQYVCAILDESANSLRAVRGGQGREAGCDRAEECGLISGAGAYPAKRKGAILSKAKDLLLPLPLGQSQQRGSSLRSG